MSAGDLVVRWGPISRIVAFRPLVVLGVVLIILVAMTIGGIALGTTYLSPDRVVSAVLGFGSRTDTLIVRQIRMPRVVEALEVGICLGVAGFLLQRATRNPLVSPSVLGIVDGAGLGVLLFLDVFSNENNALVVSVRWQPAAAALGAFVFVGLLFLLARGQLRSPVRLVLFGIALAAVAHAGMVMLMITGPIYRASEALQWMAGTVSSATWEEATLMAIAGTPLLLLAALMARSVRALDLDAESARGIGFRIVAGQVAAVILAAALTAAVISFVGGLRFVGLLAPHLAARLVGRATGVGMCGSALIGAIIVVGADLAIRIAFAPVEVPTGTVTALIGAPYFIYLLVRRRTSDG